MGGAARRFSEGYNTVDSSLGKMAGCIVRDFAVTRWLADGEVLPLAGGGGKETGLEVLHLPGHSPDSIALYLRPEGRLFVGDLLYPHACIYLNLPGSSESDFATSVERCDPPALQLQQLLQLQLLLLLLLLLPPPPPAAAACCCCCCYC